MRMNDSTKLNFALEHIAHLGDYINEDWHPELVASLQLIKRRLEEHNEVLQKRKKVVL